jgi:hypothetical protein
LGKQQDWDDIGLGLNDYDEHDLIAWDTFSVMTTLLVASAKSAWLAS